MGLLKKKKKKMLRHRITPGERRKEEGERKKN